MQQHHVTSPGKKRTTAHQINTMLSPSTGANPGNVTHSFPPISLLTNNPGATLPTRAGLQVTLAKISQFVK
jgi:hypothetical protein